MPKGKVVLGVIAFLILSCPVFGDYIPVKAKDCVLKMASISSVNPQGNLQSTYECEIKDKKLNGILDPVELTSKQKIPSAVDKELLLKEMSGQLNKFVKVGFQVKGCDWKENQKPDDSENAQSDITQVTCVLKK